MSNCILVELYARVLEYFVLTKYVVQNNRYSFRFLKRHSLIEAVINIYFKRQDCSIKIFHELQLERYIQRETFKACKQSRTKGLLISLFSTHSCISTHTPHIKWVIQQVAERFQRTTTTTKIGFPAEPCRDSQ